MKRTVLTAAIGVLLAVMHASAIMNFGMALYTDRPQYTYGNLILKYLSTGVVDTLVTRPATQTVTDGAWGASFSPDGKMIAYAYNYNSIYTMNLDGSGKKMICAAQGKEQYVTWTADNYLWWSQCDDYIYRVKADGSAAREIMYTYTDEVHNMGVSQDAKVATWCYPTWNNAGYDFTAQKLYTFGAGCHDPCSPSGKLFLFNTGGHTQAFVRTFPGDVDVDTLLPIEPGTTQNLFRYSHSTDSIVMEYVETSVHCYLHDLKNDAANQGTLLGTGIAWDFYPAEVHLGASNPVINLSAPEIDFAGEIGKSASPAVDTIRITNSMAGTTLAAVKAGGQKAWLTATIGGSGNSQYIVNRVDMSKITTAGTLLDTITVTAPPAAAATYRVQVTAFTILAADNPTNATQHGLVYDYYQGRFSTLPAFNTLSPLKEDTIGTFSLAPATRSDSFAMLFSGYINITTAGTFTFYVNADEGARLSIGPVLVVDNSGPHTATEVSGTIDLAAGMHAITVEYFQAAGPEVLTVSYTGPGITAKTPIPRSVLWNEPLAVRVISPMAGDVLRVGDSMVVSWNADCAQVPGVKVEFSVDDGLSWYLADASGALKCGTQTWKWRIPNAINLSGTQTSTISDQCLIDVANYNGSGEGFSGMFHIVAGNAVRLPLTVPALAGRLTVKPGQAGGFVVTALDKGTVRLQICRADGSVVCARGALQGPGTWTVADNRELPPGLYLARCWQNGREALKQRVMLCTGGPGSISGK